MSDHDAAWHDRAGEYFTNSIAHKADDWASLDPKASAQALLDIHCAVNRVPEADFRPFVVRTLTALIKHCSELHADKGKS